MLFYTLMYPLSMSAEMQESIRLLLATNPLLSILLHVCCISTSTLRDFDCFISFVRNPSTTSLLSSVSYYFEVRLRLFYSFS